jgi:ribosomal protein S18 acetylase RimI-like enzyme
MAIEIAKQSDLDALYHLVNEAYRGENSKLGWTTEAHLLDGLRIDKETLAGYFLNPNIILFKYTDDVSGDIIGSVYLEIRTPKLYLGMFSVSPLLQAKGVGRSLLIAAEAHANKLSCSTLTITVISTRTELIAWYQRRGFIPTGELIPFHEDEKFGIPKSKIELIVMEKQL